MNECGGWSAVSAELRKACFLRQQKCAHKKELFSRAILNLLVERETIRTSGKEVRELFDTVYADVVQGKKSDEAISLVDFWKSFR